MMAEVNAAPLSKIECAEILKTLQVTLPENEYKEIKHYLLSACSNATEEDIDLAILGISEEDEFLLMSYLMGTATHLVPLVQRPVIKQGYIIPDLLASFKICRKHQDSSAYESLKYVVDVKSTGKEKCKIGGSQLRRLREFSDHFNLPLLLAVRFTLFPQFPTWALVEDTDRAKSSITVKLEDTMNSRRELLWNDYWFSLRQDGISFKAVFTPEQGMLSCNDYGNLQRFEILVNNSVIPCSDQFKATFSYIFFTQLTEEESIIKENSTTTQILKPRMVLRAVSHTLSHFNKLGRDNRATPSSAIKILLKVSQSQTQLVVDRNMIESFMKPLLQANLLKKFTRNSSNSLSKIEHDGWDELVVNS